MEDSNVDPTKAMQQEYETARQQFDPIYYLIGFLIFLVLYIFLNKDRRVKKQEDDDPRKRVLTLDELRLYNGRGPTKEIYIACSGLVFDVTNSDFYQKGGTYENFAGRDITMASAYHSTEDKYLDMEWYPEMRLNVEQEQNIQHFFIMFCQKYKIVGSLKAPSRKDQ